jgi:hypothetical protein
MTKVREEDTINSRNNPLHDALKLDSNLNIATFNCKNVKTSSLCIEEIMKQLILLQEHWLFNYKLPVLECIHPNLNAAGKATDDENPIPAIQKPRGYGGVAILWNKSLDENSAQSMPHLQPVRAIPSPTHKSMVLVFNSKVPFSHLQSSKIFHLGPDNIPIVSQGTHLGIIRDTESAGNIPTVQKTSQMQETPSIP